MESQGGQSSTPEVNALVREMIGRVADKWTMIVLEVLEEHGTLRFTQLSAQVGDISLKMLTKTLRQLEGDGLVTRTAFMEIPPRVEYTLTPLGRSLSAAFCGVWIWAEEHHEAVSQARMAYQAAKANGGAQQAPTPEIEREGT